MGKIKHLYVSDTCRVSLCSQIAMTTRKVTGINVHASYLVFIMGIILYAMP